MNDRHTKILIIRLSSIGDVLLTTAFLRQVRQKFKSAQIDYIIKEQFKDLLLENPNISNLIVLKSKAGFTELLKIRETLKETNYNYIFDLHKNYRSLFFKMGNRAYYANAIRKDKINQTLLVCCKLNRYKNIIPIAKRYIDVGKPAGIRDDGKGLELFWNNRVDKYSCEILERNAIDKSEDFFSIAPGASYNTKRWPIEYYKELIIFLYEKYNKTIVVFGGKEDIDIGDDLAKTKGVVNLIDKLSLLETAAILSRSRILVSNDSGLMHMATAVQTPVLAIFGSTVRELGFFPWRSKHVVIENLNLDCRPCSHLGKYSCPKKHFRCMKDLTPEIVIDNFNKLLNQTNSLWKNVSGN